MNNFAVVTGAASGIGRAVCKRLYEAKVKVIGIDKKKLLHPWKTIVCDLTSENSVSDAMADIRNSTKSIKSLVHCAGVLNIGERKKAVDSNPADILKMMSANFISIVRLTQKIYPLIEKGGCIIMVSSDQAKKPEKLGVGYAASKSAIEIYAKVAGLELAAEGIRVNIVAPGPVKSNFLKTLGRNDQEIKSMHKSANEKLPFGLTRPEDVASLISFLLSNEAKRITGARIIIDGGKWTI